MWQVMVSDADFLDALKSVRSNALRKQGKVILICEDESILGV